MSVEVNSAEDLFNLLAGDDEEVPSTLIRNPNNKRKSHRDAEVDSKHMQRLNKVEDWMKQDDAITSDPREYFSFGMSLYETLLTSTADDLSIPIVQKVTKLMLLWLKLSKSCRLLEPQIQVEDILESFRQLCSTKKLPGPILDVGVRVLTALISCSPDRLMKSPTLVSEFNHFIARWAKGSLKVNPDKVLSPLPSEFLSCLTFVPSQRHFVNTHIVEFLIKILKKSNTIQVDLDSFIESSSTNQTETDVLRLCAAYLRSVQSLPSPAVIWLNTIVSRDPKQSGVSTKNIQLANQILRDLDSKK